MWCHGGLSCGLEARYLDQAGREAGADIIAIDRPGIGHSEASVTPSIAHWPQTVAQVLDALHIGELAVAGWSAGGPYALACAAVMPTRVRTVATLAGMAPLEHWRHVIQLGLWADVLLIAASRRAPKGAAALLRLARLAPDRYFTREILRKAGSLDRAALTGRHRWLLEALREATAGGVSGVVEDYRRFGGPWGFDPGEVARPVTVWQGAQDTLVPMSHARRLANALPNSTFRIIPLAGHYLPAVIADTVLDDLAP